MDVDPTKGTRRKEKWVPSFQPETLNAKFQNLIRYIVKRRVQYRYQSILDLEQISNDSMHDFIVCVTQADDPSELDLVGLCRVITLRKVIEAVRKVDRVKRIGLTQLESNELVMDVRDRRTDSSPVDVAVANNLREAVLRSLSLRQQDILNKRMDGWSVDQIAVSMNFSVKTVRREIISIVAVVQRTRTEFNDDSRIAVAKKREARSNEQRFLSLKGIP